VFKRPFVTFPADHPQIRRLQNALSKEQQLGRCIVVDSPKQIESNQAYGMEMPRGFETLVVRPSKEYAFLERHRQEQTKKEQQKQRKLQEQQKQQQTGMRSTSQVLSASFSTTSSSPISPFLPSSSSSSAPGSEAGFNTPFVFYGAYPQPSAHHYSHDIENMDWSLKHYREEHRFRPFVMVRRIAVHPHPSRMLPK